MYTSNVQSYDIVKIQLRTYLTSCPNRVLQDAYEGRKGMSLPAAKDTDMIGVV